MDARDAGRCDEVELASGHAFPGFQAQFLVYKDAETTSPVTRDYVYIASGGLQDTPAINEGPEATPVPRGVVRTRRRRADPGGQTDGAGAVFTGAPRPDPGMLAFDGDRQGQNQADAAGAKSWKGRCPFHGEKTPFFHVYDDHFRCFGCRIPREIITYVQKCRNLSSPDTVKHLAGRAGLEIPA